VGWAGGESPKRPIGGEADLEHGRDGFPEKPPRSYYPIPPFVPLAGLAVHPHSPDGGGRYVDGTRSGSAARAGKGGDCWRRVRRGWGAGGGRCNVGHCFGLSVPDRALGHQGRVRPGGGVVGGRIPGQKINARAGSVFLPNLRFMGNMAVGFGQLPSGDSGQVPSGLVQRRVVAGGRARGNKFGGLRAGSPQKTTNHQLKHNHKTHAEQCWGALERHVASKRNDPANGSHCLSPPPQVRTGTPPTGHHGQPYPRLEGRMETTTTKQSPHHQLNNQCRLFQPKAQIATLLR